MLSFMETITQLINAAEAGSTEAAQKLFDRVYDDLRRMATTKIAGESPNLTLQPTALVHEVYLRMFGIQREKDVRTDTAWRSRSHFFSAAAQAMRRILVEEARKRGRQKRGGGAVREMLNPDQIAEPDLADDLLILNDALDRLTEVAPVPAKLVMLRYFGGLTIRETAESLGISPRTADSYWAYARAWLLAEMQRMREMEESS